MNAVAFPQCVRGEVFLTQLSVLLAGRNLRGKSGSRAGPQQRERLAYSKLIHIRFRCRWRSGSSWSSYAVRLCSTKKLLTS